MIGYVTLGTNDTRRAAEFYDALLAEIGAERMLENDREIVWMGANGGPAISILRPFDGNPATVGNGVMVAFLMKSREQVDAFYQKAIELGGMDEGAPGPRGDGFYAGYFRDLDGNKLNAFVLG